MPEVRECAHPVTPEHVRGDVEFRSVCFSYVENRQVLEDISFTVPAGSALGIVGHTGAGKAPSPTCSRGCTTRKSGEVLIDGINLRELSSPRLARYDCHRLAGDLSVPRHDYGKHPTRAPTRPTRRSSTRPKSRRRTISSSNTPDGYETMVGFGHKDLSGGERQRISIARRAQGPEHPHPRRSDGRDGHADRASRFSRRLTA